MDGEVFVLDFNILINSFGFNYSYRNIRCFRMWHIGQRVVCVDDSKSTHATKVFKGNIYTIREFVIRPISKKYGIRLQEISNDKVHVLGFGFVEPAYCENRFRPLDEKRIDIFRAMLKNKEKEKVA